MENKDIERVKYVSVNHIMKGSISYSDGFIAGAHYEHVHLQAEIQRLKGLIEEAYNDGAEYEGNNHKLGYEQFKTKHEL
jgi:hypothetical protein